MSDKLAQGVMNGAGAIKRALDGYNAPGSVDFSQTLERTGHGFEHASESEIREWKKPAKNSAVARALNK